MQQPFDLLNRLNDGYYVAPKSETLILDSKDDDNQYYFYISSKIKNIIGMVITSFVNKLHELQKIY